MQARISLSPWRIHCAFAESLATCENIGSFERPARGPKAMSKSKDKKPKAKTNKTKLTTKEKKKKKLDKKNKKLPGAA